jgi:CRISPR-associated protein Cmr2
MHILVISIGPVQEFIESARKCRDLWFGSWLLSELARAAAKAIVDAEGRPEPDVLIFPGANTEDKGRAVANKIVARIQNDPQEIARLAEERLRDRLTQIRDEAFAKVAPRRENRLTFFCQDKAKEQVNALIEFLWSAVEEKDNVTYARTLEEAERVLAAVKNSKRWGQPSWAKEGVPKSSLDGIRESVLSEQLYDNPRNQSRSADLSDRRRRVEFGVHSSERLCGVGLLKRFGSTKDHNKDHPERIFSTSHVASGPFRAGLARLHGGQVAWNEYLLDLRTVDHSLTRELDNVPRPDTVTGKIDGSVFYEGRLIETLDELGYNEHEDKQTFRNARGYLREFLRKTRTLGEPLPYYALLLADGDRMGKVISTVEEFSKHRALSKMLEDFASSTRDTVEKQEGALVYAGGDDVLALLPLHTLLCCARQLADGFAAQMEEWKVKEKEAGGDREVMRSPTLSMGIAIVHHLLPLDEALALVRQTEKVAKKVDGKNALAITVKKRGGEPVQVVGSWDQLDVRLANLIELHLQGAVSVKTQYELMDLAGRTRDAGSLEETMKKVRETEARRILARKQSRGGASKISSDTFDTLERLAAFTNPARLGQELYVAHLLAQAIEQAHPREPSTEAHQEIRS